MTDFDKLIKEKTEQAEYSYKPSAWRQFQKKAGIKSSKTRYWTIGLSSVLVVGGIATFFGYRYNHVQPTESTLSVPSVDTISSQVTVSGTEILTAETYQVSGTELKTPKKHLVQDEQQKERVVDSATQTTPKMKTSRVEKTPRYGRPLVIDVDTIKENVPTDEELKNGNSRLY